ncbi:hypothetical protein A3Q56_00291 [Intoshia linei]|uniref:Major facilitator superfamily (MFS) profile domain-containing protein n=1 Tax=Intoshia linei TaxID=1819745 RepID=A0A177BEG0_9BILA|nr:hypothetical protein A3Q56_00291 [Intoshia linei]
MKKSISESSDVDIIPKNDEISPLRKKLMIAVMTFINLCNFADRFAVAGVLSDVKIHFGTKDAELSDGNTGLIQTSFVIVFMIMSPIFGYLGDRYNRKIILIFSQVCWLLSTLSATYVPDGKFMIFLFCRSMVGVGEASYATITPSLIGSIYSGTSRTTALIMFSLAIPIGSGLGYVLSSLLTSLFDSWRWGLRFSGVNGIIGILLILFVMKEPTRTTTGDINNTSKSSWIYDMKCILSKKTYILTTLGFTCFCFIVGALSFWSPHFMSFAYKMQHHSGIKLVPTIYGILTCAGGLIGVILSKILLMLFGKYSRYTDSYICSFSLLGSLPFLFCAIYLAETQIIATWILVAIGITILCLIWALNTDILLKVIEPQRRSAAVSTQILISHAFGDAGSPYLVGLFSDLMKNSYSYKSPAIDFFSLQFSLYLTLLAASFGGVLYFCTTLFIDGETVNVEEVKPILNSDSDESQLSNTKSINETSSMLPNYEN